MKQSKICDEVTNLGCKSFAEAFFASRAFAYKFRSLGPWPTIKREMPSEAKAGKRLTDEAGGKLREVPSFIGTFDDFATRCQTEEFGEGFKRELTDKVARSPRDREEAS